MTDDQSMGWSGGSGLTSYELVIYTLPDAPVVMGRTEARKDP